MSQTQTSPAVQTPTFNPKSFQRDFTALALQSPKKAATMAGDWRVRLENALIEAETATEMALQMATIGGSNLAFSTLTGWLSEKKKGIEAKWQLSDLAGDATQVKSAEWKANNPNGEFSKTTPFKDGKIKDPTKLVGIPLSLWLVGGTGLVSWLARNSDQGVIARGVATGALTNMTSELGATFGRNMYIKKNTVVATT